MAACKECKFYKADTNVCLNVLNEQAFTRYYTETQQIGTNEDGSPIMGDVAMSEILTHLLDIPSPDWSCELFEQVARPAVDEFAELLGLTTTTDSAGVEWVNMPWGPVERQKWRPELNSQNTMELMSAFADITKRRLSIAAMDTRGKWIIKDEFNKMEKTDIEGSQLSREVTTIILKELHRFLDK